MGYDGRLSIDFRISADLRLSDDPRVSIDRLPLDSLSRRKSILESRYVFVGRDWALLDFARTTGSRVSLAGALPSNDGREEDGCRTWPSCGL
jgi:hypothetical protein